MMVYLRTLMCCLSMLYSVACIKKVTEQVAPALYTTIAPVDLQIPAIQGWGQDTNLPQPPAVRDQSSIVLRLVQKNAVVGSPRIDVVLDAGSEPMVLEDFLTRNLRDMAALEQSGHIHILHVQQHKLSLGEHQQLFDAYRVDHTYTIGRGANQIEINQISLFMVLYGRGIAITAVGRTELFEPLVPSIEHMLMHVRIKPSRATKTKNSLQRMPAYIDSIDLGVIGGHR